MLIGHLPVGYLVTHAFIKKFKLGFKWYWFFIGLAASILPDFDIFYQLFFNKLEQSHRYYITNSPIFYLTIFIIVVIVSSFIKKNWLKYGILLIFSNIFIHLLLDTVFYGIRWFWPIYPKLIAIYNIDGTGGIRVMNYYHHWYWYLEIALWIIVPIFIIYSFIKRKYRTA